MIKELTYAFRQLRQCIDHLENMENERSGREEKRSLGDPQCMSRSQYKGEAPIIHANIETILNDLQERLKAHENRLTAKVFQMEKFV